MDLDEWMWRNKVTAVELCRRTGLNVNTVGSVKRRQKVPRLDTVILLYWVTNQEVPLIEFLPKEKTEELKKYMEDNDIKIV